MDNNKINEAALTKRLKTLVLQGRFEDAQKELEGIDIQRLKNNSILCLVGEVYMGLGEYNEAERVLLRVYEKNPTARRILDLLTTLYIEKKEYSEAEYYYKEFISVASKDLHRYILRYRIDKGKNERLSVLIHTLEKLKEYEYIEEWAYELAELYDQSGQKKKCLHECEEIVLWFGHGEYVDKAIALRCKLTGEPLPEMTTVEMYKAEEERRAREQKEQEMVYAEISRRSANPVVDGLEDVFDGSIDTEMIQQALEDRGDASDKGKASKDEPAKEEKAEEQEAPAEEAAADQKEETASAPEEALNVQAAEEEDDEVIPESELEAAEKDEKESISQIFGNLMSGKLFGRLRQNKKEDAEEEAEAKEPAAETAQISAEEAEAAELPAEAEAAEVPAEAEETEGKEAVPAAEEEPSEAEAELVNTESDDLEKHADEDQDDEVLEEELDLSIFEMKADQDFEDSIIQSMDAAIKASFGEQAEEAGPEEAAEEEAASEEVTEEEAASEEAVEEEAASEEVTEEEAVSEEVTAEEEAAPETAEDTETAEEKTVEEQAASFAEAITAAVGAPSNFISDQTEKFMSDDEEEEEDEIIEELPEDEEEIAEELLEEELHEEAAEEAEETTEAPQEEAVEETEGAAEEPQEEAAEEAEEATEEPQEEAVEETEEAAEELQEEPAAETAAAEADQEDAAETQVEEEAEVEAEPQAEEEAEAEAETQTEEETEAEEEIESDAEIDAEVGITPETEDEKESEVEGDEEVAADDEDEDEIIEESDDETSADEEDEDEIIEESDDETAVDEEDEDEIIEESDDETTADEDDEDEDEIIEDEDEDEDEIIAEGSDSAFIKSLFAQDETGALTEEVKEAVPEEKAEEPEEEEDFEDEFSDSLQASDTVLDIFGAVANVKSIQQQLTETFTKFEFQDNIDLLAPYDINFVVTGEDMSVKSQIAIGIAKALNTYQICDKNKLVRASAADLNERDFTSIFEKIKGGCLIIESADQLNENAVQIISDYIQKDNQDVAIVLEGEEKPLMEMFSHNRLLRQRFLNIIHIGKYNESELVQLAIAYAKKKGYEVSREAAPVLRQLFRERMDKGESVNYEDIIVIVENAVSSLEKRNMENLFMTVLDNKYEEAAMFLLQPQDFQTTEDESEELL